MLHGLRLLKPEIIYYNHLRTVTCHSPFPDKNVYRMERVWRKAKVRSFSVKNADTSL